MEALIKNQKWTYQDMLEKLPAESRYEIIDNELYDMSPAPNPKHQFISFDFAQLLNSFIKLQPLGKVCIAPFDVFLDKNNIVQPDIFIIFNEKLSKISARGFEGAPDLIVEIISPSSVYRDQIEKKDLYEKFGVKEYWIVDPANKVIEVLVLNAENKYELNNYVAEKGIVASILLNGFEVNADILFSSNL